MMCSIKKILNYMYMYNDYQYSYMYNYVMSKKLLNIKSEQTNPVYCTIIITKCFLRSINRSTIKHSGWIDYNNIKTKLNDNLNGRSINRMCTILLVNGTKRNLNGTTTNGMSTVLLVMMVADSLVSCPTFRILCLLYIITRIQAAESSHE